MRIYSLDVNFGQSQFRGQPYPTGHPLKLFIALSISRSWMLSLATIMINIIFAQRSNILAKARKKVKVSWGYLITFSVKCHWRVKKSPALARGLTFWPVQLHCSKTSRACNLWDQGGQVQHGLLEGLLQYLQHLDQRSDHLFPPWRMPPKDFMEREVQADLSDHPPTSSLPSSHHSSFLI